MGPQLLRNIIEELNRVLSGGVVSKIHQPDERNIILRVYSRGREERLIISAHPGFSRIHLTERSFANPPAPLRFCAYLRSRITNARIEGFSQIDVEKIVEINLKKGHDTSIESFKLISELTGKSSNIILLDDKGVVLDSLKYFPPESIRAVMPGMKLTPLPKPPGKVEEEELTDKDGYPTWNLAADAYYSGLVDKEEEVLEKNRLRRVINEALKKARRKLENLRGDEKKANEEIGYSYLGEILVANFKKMKRGMREVEADDYTKIPPEKVRIQLDERLGPRENVEKYFKRAKKAKVALTLLNGRIPEVERELEYMESLIYEWEACRAVEDLKALEDELFEGGYLGKMQGKEEVEKAEAQKAEPIRRYTSSEGFEILCGKSGTGNDLIVKKYAKDEDIWFHASKVPGSHVLIKVAGRGKELTKKTIEEAASLAAWHSKNQGASKAEVVYTEACNVKKPRGAKPGLVTIKDYKTIVVKPKGMEGGT